MQQETTTALEIFETGLTKSDIKQMAVNAIASVLENGNPLQVAEALTAMENFIKEVKDTKEFKDYVREETVKYGKNYVSPSGAKIEIAETGTKYDFTKCNYFPLVDAYAELDLAEKAVKVYETFAKSIPSEGMDFVTKDGEVCRSYPPSKTSTSSYKVTLAK